MNLVDRLEDIIDKLEELNCNEYEEDTKQDIIQELHSIKDELEYQYNL